MKKLKWIVLSMLVLVLVTNIKASSCVTTKKEKAAKVVKVESVTDAPATLIEQIFFPHGI